MNKCAMAAWRRGYRVFAIQHGGWCAASHTAYRTYSKYGRSNKCRNGKGGPWANDVYFLKGELHFFRTCSDTQEQIVSYALHQLR